MLRESTWDLPFLNALESYTPVDLTEIDERQELEYYLLTKDMQISTILDYESFIRIFRQCMEYVTSVERDCYCQ